MDSAVVTQASPPPTPRRRTWFRVSGVEWAIFGSAAIFLTGLMLVALFFAEQQLLRTARSWDLDRVERYIRLCRDKLEAEALTKPPEESLREMQDIGLFIDVFPPEKEIPQPNPRYVPALQSVEAWERVRGADGQPVSVIRIGRYDSTSRLTLRAVRFYTAAVALVGALIIGFIWFLLRRAVLRKIDFLTAEIASSETEPVGAEVAADGPLGALRATALGAIASQGRHVAQLQALLARHNELACSSTREGALTEANEAYCRFFGKSREELVGSSYLDLIPPSDRTDAINNLRKLSRRNPVHIVEHRAVLPDGSVRWIRWTNTAVLGDDDTVNAVLSLGADITAEKNLADRISTLQGAFGQMQSLAQTGSLTWDFTRDRMEWTDETWRLLGLDKQTDQPSLDNLLATVTNNDRESLRELFRKARDDGDPFEHEFRCVLPDGSRRTLQSRAEVRADPQTKILDQLTCTLRDITALRDAEAATKRELRFREAVEQSLASGIVASDDEGRIFSVNPAFCAKTGWTEQELLGLVAPYPYWPEEEIPAIRRAFDTTLGGRTPEEGYQLRFCRKDGTRFDVLIKVAPLLDDHDRRLGWLGAVTDITAIQQIRRELTVTNERLQTAQNVVEFGIWDWDPVQDKLFWDRQSFALFGHPDATDAEAVWAEALSEEERERLTYELQRLIAAGGSSGEDLLRAEWPDGSRHEISSTYLVMRDERGKATRVFGVNRDITNEMETERELRDAHERLTAALEGGQFGTFEHVIGEGDYNWNLANYEMNGIDPSVTEPAELFAVWKKGTRDFFPQLMVSMAALPSLQNNYTYEFTAYPEDEEPRRIRVSLFIERNKQGHPARLVGISRRLD